MRVFFDEKITQYRLNTNVETKVEEYKLYGTIYGSIKPAKAEDVMLAEGVPYETFKLYCENYNNIKEGDKLVSVVEYAGDNNNLQTVEENNIVNPNGDITTISIANEYIVKTVRRYGLKNIQRVECYLTLLRQ